MKQTGTDHQYKWRLPSRHFLLLLDAIKAALKNDHDNHQKDQGG
jgi:hypothetical protein